MRRLIILLAGGLGALALASPAPAGATTTSPVTVTVGSPITLTARALVQVPVNVVCDPLPGLPFSDEVHVGIIQASGKSISHGEGTATASSPAFLVCDGTTVNQLAVLVTPTDVPFHGGAAILTVFASHETGQSCGPGCFFNIQSESGGVGPVPVKIRG
jgi:hypothetical protein